MSFKNIEMDRSNPFMDKALDKKIKERIFARESREFLRAVPFLAFDFFDAITSDGFVMPGPDEDDDYWDENLCFEIKPMATALRVMIRPDVSKKEAVRILNKIIKIIGEDKSDWTDDFNKFIADLKEEKAVND